jgi:hypothetical protein
MAVNQFAAVAQVSKPAVSPISKSAACPLSPATRVWKPATQLTWKSALRNRRAAFPPLAAQNPEIETGGERGIRTLDTLLEYARFPGVCLQPLGHLSRRLFTNTLRSFQIYKLTFRYCAHERTYCRTKNLWLKTPFANPVRYVPSGIYFYFSRIRVRGKLIRRSLKTDTLSAAKLRTCQQALNRAPKPVSMAGHPLCLSMSTIHPSKPKALNRMQRILVMLRCFVAE